MKIGILPIDSRPCNIDFVKQLNNIANLDIELDILPKQFSGEFFKKAELNKVREFLIGNSLTWNYAIISLDMLCFGGLIQARSWDDIDIEKCLKSIDVIRQMKQQNPDLKIYAYSVIMRLTISVTGTAGIEDWENIFEYSKLKYLYLKNPSDLNKINLDNIIAKIPKNILDEYLKVRERNHLVNCEAIKLVNDGIIEFLDCCQEDSQEQGIQKIEHEVLNNLIVENVVMRNGTDEEVAILFARIINDHYNKQPGFNFLLPNNYENNVALYEDRKTWENIIQCVNSVNGKIVQKNAEINILTSDFPCKDTNLDMCFELTNDVLTKNDSHQHIAKHAKNADAFLDIAFANGGNPYSLDCFYKINNKLLAYSGWNTATNSIGTIVANCSILAANKDYDKKANDKFLHERIIDDCLYQGKVRKLINEKLVKDEIDIWNFAEEKRVFCDRLLNELLNDEYLIFCKNNALKPYKIKCNFPWTRTFEIEVLVYE